MRAIRGSTLGGDRVSLRERGAALLETLIGAGLITFVGAMLYASWVDQDEFRADAHAARNPAQLLEEAVLRLSASPLLLKFTDNEWRHYSPSEARTAGIIPAFYESGSLRFNEEFYPYKVSVRRTALADLGDDTYAVHYDVYILLTRPDGATAAPERTSLLAPSMEGGAFGVGVGHGVGTVDFATNAVQTEATQAWQTSVTGTISAGGYLFSRSHRTLPRKVERRLHVTYHHSAGDWSSHPRLQINDKGRLAPGRRNGNFLTHTLPHQYQWRRTWYNRFSSSRPFNAFHPHETNGAAPIDPIRNPKTMMIAWLLANGWTLEPVGGSMESALALGTHEEATEAATWTGAAGDAPTCPAGQRLATIAEPHAVFRQLELLPGTHKNGIRELGVPARTGDDNHQFTHLIRKTRNPGDYILKAWIDAGWELPEKNDFPIEHGWWRVADQTDESYALDFTGHVWKKWFHHPATTNGVYINSSGFHSTNPHQGFGLKNPFYAFPKSNSVAVNMRDNGSLAELLDFMPYPMLMQAAYRAMGMDYAGKPDIPVHDKINPAHRVLEVEGAYEENSYGGPIIEASGDEESTWLSLWETLDHSLQQQYPAYNWRHTAQTSGGDLFMRPGGHNGGFGLLGLERAVREPLANTCLSVDKSLVDKLVTAVNNNTTPVFSNDELQDLFTIILDSYGWQTPYQQVGCLVHHLGMASPHTIFAAMSSSNDVTLYDLYNDATISDGAAGSDFNLANDIVDKILSDSKGSSWWLEGLSSLSTISSERDYRLLYRSYLTVDRVDSAYTSSFRAVDAKWALAVLYAVRAREYMAGIESGYPSNIYRLRQTTTNRMNPVEQKIASTASDDDWTTKAEGKAFLAGTMEGMTAGQVPRPSRNFIMAASTFYGYARCTSTYNTPAERVFNMVSVSGFGALRSHLNGAGITDDYQPSDETDDNWKFNLAVIGADAGGNSNITIYGHYYPLDACGGWTVVPSVSDLGHIYSEYHRDYEIQGTAYPMFNAKPKLVTIEADFPAPIAWQLPLSGRGHFSYLSYEGGDAFSYSVRDQIIDTFGTGRPLPNLGRNTLENRYIGAYPTEWFRRLFSELYVFYGYALYEHEPTGVSQQQHPESHHPKVLDRLEENRVLRDSQIRVFFPDSMLNKLSLCVPQE